MEKSIALVHKSAFSVVKKMFRFFLILCVSFEFGAHCLSSVDWSASGDIERIDFFYWLSPYKWRPWIHPLEQSRLPVFPVPSPNTTRTTGTPKVISSSGSLLGRWWNSIIRRRVFQWIAIIISVKMLLVLFVALVLPNLYFLVMMDTDDMDHMSRWFWLTTKTTWWVDIWFHSVSCDENGTKFALAVLEVLIPLISASTVVSPFTHSANELVEFLTISNLGPKGHKSSVVCLGETGHFYRPRVTKGIAATLFGGRW